MITQIELWYRGLQVKEVIKYHVTDFGLVIATCQMYGGYVKMYPTDELTVKITGYSIPR